MQKAIYSMSALSMIINQPLQNLNRWQAEGKTGIEKTESKLSIENVLGLIIYAQVRLSGDIYTEKIPSIVKDIMKNNRKGLPLPEYADFGYFQIRLKTIFDTAFEDSKHFHRRTPTGSTLYTNTLMYCFLFDSLLKGKHVVNSF